MATSTSNRPSRIRLGVGVELLFYLAIGSGNQRRYTFEALFPGCAISILLFAVLWIGGPFGATQALGEYLRPVSVERTGLVTLCEENETPPPDVRESQAWPQSRGASGWAGQRDFSLDEIQHALSSWWQFGHALSKWITSVRAGTARNIALRGQILRVGL